MNQRLYIIGGGAVGSALATLLALQKSNIQPVLVRIRKQSQLRESQLIRLHHGSASVREAIVPTCSLEQISAFDGPVILTSKSFTNVDLAPYLRPRLGNHPLVILQNGIDVEQPFLDSGIQSVYRGVLLMSAQFHEDHSLQFCSVVSSPIGIIRGSMAELENVVTALSCPDFPFHTEPAIQPQIWQKAIINSVFNSICALLEVDNGIFARNEDAVALAREIVDEGVRIAEGHLISLKPSELVERIIQISCASSGVNISTLQDLQNKRPTEIESLNLALSAKAIACQPSIPSPKIALLGQLTLLKSQLVNSQSLNE